MQNSRKHVFNPVFFLIVLLVMINSLSQNVWAVELNDEQKTNLLNKINQAFDYINQAWDVIDSLYKKAGEPPPQKEVLDCFNAEKIVSDAQENLKNSGEYREQVKTGITNGDYAEAGAGVKNLQTAYQEMKVLLGRAHACLSNELKESEANRKREEEEMVLNLLVDFEKFQEENFESPPDPQAEPEVWVSIFL